jgi:phosphohistidine phosphatase
MRLYLFRHGIAIRRDDPACPAEAERHLTDKGVQRTRQAALGLRALGAAPEKVLVSPYVRAVQTGELAAEALGLDRKDFITVEELLPHADPEALLRRLPEIGDRDLVLVGHAPHMDLFLATALGEPGRVFTSLKKAGAACLEMDGPQALPARLVWLLEARTLRLLGQPG